MTAGVETLAMEDFLHDILVSATGLKVWSDTIPQDETYPAVLFAFLDGADIIPLGPQRVAVEASYAVRVYDETESFADLATFAANIDAALTGQVYAIKTNGTVLQCRRETPLVTKEVYDGVSYSALGGVYSLIAQ
jgi:hypothetical protein